MTKISNIIELPRHGDGWREHSAHSAALNYAQSVVEAGAGAGVIDVNKYYDELTTDKERGQFLDTLSTRLSMSDVGWAQLYTALSLIKDHPEYLRKKGFKTFDEFLKARIGGALETWRKLENLYHYAKLACPELFEISDTEMATLRAQLHEAMTTKANKLKKQSSDKEINEASSLRRMGNELQGAVSLIKSGHGEHSLVRVIRRASREKPALVAEIQRQLLAGETKQGPDDVGKFIAIDQYGRKKWLISEIEKAIGKQTKKDQVTAYKTHPPSITQALKLFDRALQVEGRESRKTLASHMLSRKHWLGQQIHRMIKDGLDEKK